jgi:hypothetical protein
MSSFVNEIVEQPSDPLGGASGQKRLFNVQFLAKENNPDFPFTVANEVIAAQLGICLGLSVPSVLSYRIAQMPLVFIQMIERDAEAVKEPPASSSLLHQHVQQHPDEVHAAIVFDLFIANNDRAFGPMRRNLALDYRKRLFLYDHGNSCFYRNRPQANIVAGVARLNAVASDLRALFDMRHKQNHYWEFLTDWKLVEKHCERIRQLPDFIIQSAIDRVPDYLEHPSAAERLSLAEFLNARKNYLLDHIAQQVELFSGLPKRGTHA